MKYMGSKRAMLQNGLGELLDVEIVRRRRFVDLFAGSGVVSTHVAGEFNIPVLAFDLQKYSAVLTNAVINRERPLNWKPVWRLWKRRARSRFAKSRIPSKKQLTQAVVRKFRKWCNNQNSMPITKAYGGHYFSPHQTVWIDALLATLPKRKPARTVALAALIQSASRCAAAPGHTAQPFQPTRTAKPYLADAWKKDIVHYTRESLSALAEQFAQRRGNARVKDANEAAKQLRRTDIAFIDPPYSDVHYSRFYHVLETIARQESVPVSGEGRYPAPERRPWSKYSVQSEASKALGSLLATIASRGAKAILTFPVHQCSNGLSGAKVRRIARKYFDVDAERVHSTLSSLGGKGNGNGEAGRAARKKTKELMLLLNPR